jgi:hypothetical protein
MVDRIAHNCGIELNTSRYTSGRTDCGKLMNHNSKTRGSQVHSNEEVEMTYG